MKKIFFIAMLLCASITTNAQVTIGSDIVPERAALLDLKSQAPNANNATTDKGGLLLPRVELVDRSTLEPFIAAATAAEKKNHTGLTVYNVTTNAAKDLAPGFYYWNGATWMTMITTLPAVQNSMLSQRNLQTTTVSELGNSMGTGAVPLDFETITIPESGNYAFNFRLYGDIDRSGSLNNPQRCIYYISLWLDGVLADIAEINIRAFVPETATNIYTYSVTLGTYASAGQTVTIKWAHHSSTPYPWSLTGNPTGISAARTSMIWWKL